VALRILAGPPSEGTNGRSQGDRAKSAPPGRKWEEVLYGLYKRYRRQKSPADHKRDGAKMNPEKSPKREELGRQVCTVLAPSRRSGLLPT